MNSRPLAIMDEKSIINDREGVKRKLEFLKANLVIESTGDLASSKNIASSSQEIV